MCAMSWFSCRNGWRVGFRYIRGDHLNHPPPTIKIKSIAMTQPSANDEAGWGRRRIYQAKSGNIFSCRLRRIAPYPVVIINEQRVGEKMRDGRNRWAQQPYTKLIINLDANVLERTLKRIQCSKLDFVKLMIERMSLIIFSPFCNDIFHAIPFLVPWAIIRSP